MDGESTGAVTETTETVDTGTQNATEQTEQTQQPETAPAAGQADAAEMERMREELRREFERQVSDVYTSLGVKHPGTGKPVTNKAEYEEARATELREKAETELSRAGISKEAIEAVVQLHPDVRKAKELEAKFEAEQRRLQDENARRAAEEQVRKIAKYDPSIKTVEDLAKQPNFAEIRDRVYKHGDTLDEAYEWVNREKIAEAKAARAAREAQNSQSSKAHMTAAAGASGAATGDVEVPESVAQGYRAANPKMTKKEMQEKYKRFLQYKRN